MAVPAAAEFMARYQELLDAEPLAPASRLVGGVRARRGVDPGTVQPLIGVYLLMLRGKLVVESAATATT